MISSCSISFRVILCFFLILQITNCSSRKRRNFSIKNGIFGFGEEKKEILFPSPLTYEDMLKCNENYENKYFTSLNWIACHSEEAITQAAEEFHRDAILFTATVYPSSRFCEKFLEAVYKSEMDKIKEEENLIESWKMELNRQKFTRNLLILAAVSKPFKFMETLDSSNKKIETSEEYNFNVASIFGHGGRWLVGLDGMIASHILELLANSKVPDYIIDSNDSYLQNDPVIESRKFATHDASFDPSEGFKGLKETKPLITKFSFSDHKFVDCTFGGFGNMDYIGKLIYFKGSRIEEDIKNKNEWKVNAGIDHGSFYILKINNFESKDNYKSSGAMLFGLETSAPSTYNQYGNYHGISAVSHEIGITGGTKYRGFIDPSINTIKNKGGIKSIITRDDINLAMKVINLLDILEKVEIFEEFFKITIPNLELALNLFYAIVNSKPMQIRSIIGKTNFLNSIKAAEYIIKELDGSLMSYKTKTDDRSKIQRLYSNIRKFQKVKSYLRLSSRKRK